VTLPPIIERKSPNWNARPAGAEIDLLILHYTGMQSAAAALDRLCDPGPQVSSHYLIDEDGTIYRLVDEARRAWHAGSSSWQGREDVNSFSIGIELVNPGHEWGYRDFPPAQMAACTSLTRDIVRRHAIAPARVLGHADVAPTRKQDPGERFDWAALARHGVGLFPPDTPAEPADATDPTADAIIAFQSGLAAYGYACPASGTLDEATRAAVIAFQRHYRPARVDGRFDADCRHRLAWLLAALD
jgi:N-acetylmuramoyl-L-alanine amidase